VVGEFERSPDGALEDVGGLALNVDFGPQRLRLALGEATVAVLSDGGHVTSVHWQGGEPFEEMVETSADRLTLLHIRGAKDSFHYEVLPLGPKGMTAPLAPGVPYERADPRAGTLRLAVTPEAASDAERPLTLHVRGAGAEAVLVAGDGRVARGTDLALGKEGGTLWGTAEVTASRVTKIGEGLGPERLLPAGGTALFSFTVTREGPVGIGVRASPDVVSCTLLDAQGKRLGTGVVQMPTLQPGT